MNLLVDVSAGQSVTDALRALGHDVTFVRDHDPAMIDADILAWAVREGRYVVTMDKDFGDSVFRSGLAHLGVLLPRLEAARNAEKVAVVTDIFTRFGDQLPGRFACTKTAGFASGRPPHTAARRPAFTGWMLLGCGSAHPPAVGNILFGLHRFVGLKAVRSRTM
jgi:predicted nuclease of predicted toxin-antitoxin system